MDFWNVYESARAKPDLGTGRLLITSRDRIHLSLSTVENYAYSLDMDRGIAKRFSEASRYVLVTEITHDLFVSIFDVNTTQSLLLSFSSPLNEADVKRVAWEVGRMKKPNLEMRIIGLQNKDNWLL